MTLFTLGFTKKSAEEFFGRLKRSGAARLVDVRLNNVSQLAGFTKKDDLRFFTQAICGIPYLHLPILAPTQAMLDGYKKAKGGWEAYERQFLALMADRKVEREVSREQLDGACVLCSEDRPDHCHRRLIAEYLQRHWGDVDIIHL